MWLNIVGLLVTFVFSMIAAPLAVKAQAPTKIPRVGILRHDAPPNRFIDDLRQGLHELGYVEGQNLILEMRWAAGQVERLAALAAELVSLPVDVIVTSGPLGVRAAQAATSTIPIVMGRMDDADVHGFVASLAHPGGNVTGLSFQTGDLSGKWLELLKEAAPQGSRVAVLWDATGTMHQRHTLEATARGLGISSQVLEVRSHDEFDGAFAAAQAVQADGLVILASPLFTVHTSRLAALAARSRLPAIYYHRGFTEAGGLMSYGPQESDASWGWRRAAVFVDKILKGAKPADLPVERPTKFELVLNLKTAKALGLTIPPSLLLQADGVIK
jgi:putative tryptophan/tyrosine transport system substrate-binding protein